MEEQETWVRLADLSTRGWKCSTDEREWYEAEDLDYMVHFTIQVARGTTRYKNAWEVTRVTRIRLPSTRRAVTAMIAKQNVIVRKTISNGLTECRSKKLWMGESLSSQEIINETLTCFWISSAIAERVSTRETRIGSMPFLLSSVVPQVCGTKECAGNREPGETSKKPLNVSIERKLLTKTSWETWV